MISSQLAKLLLNEALKTGADFAELYIEKTNTHNITYDNNKIEGISDSISFGIGVRLLKGNRSVYGYTNEVKQDKILDLINHLVDAFNDKQIISVEKFKTRQVKINCPIKKSSFDTPIEEKIKMLRTASDAMKEYSPLIIRTINKFISSKKEIEIFNSKGLHVKDYKERVLLSLTAVAMLDDKREIGYNSFGFNGGMENFAHFDLIKEARKVANEAVSILYAKECPSGKMSVIVANGFGGVLFHEACGHSLEASSVGIGLSVFANRLGEQIASPIVNAYDDGTMQNKWGSENIDDEGNPTQKICLIKNGVLTNYLIDSFNGRRMNKDGNGTCRRQSYRLEPTSRMSNTYIANGTSTVEEIIKNTKLGLYAKHLGGGSVDPSTGQFEFACSVAFIVRDGKICEQVKGATLIGTGEEILKNIDMIANDLDFDCGFCGAASGSVPVTTGQPTIRIKEILVGGSGEKIS